MDERAILVPPEGIPYYLTDPFPWSTVRSMLSREVVEEFSRVIEGDVIWLDNYPLQSETGWEDGYLEFMVRIAGGGWTILRCKDDTEEATALFSLIEARERSEG